MNNILVTGSNGQLGSELQELARNSADLELLPNVNFHFATRDTLDITNKSAIAIFCSKNNISTIINCAAYTAVDQAESDIENANKVNHLAVKYLAKIAKKQHIKLIHISTDYVFDGKNYKPYAEDDTPNPKNVYGKTKLAGENILIKVSPPNTIIIRTSWVYSSFGNNFVKTMLKLGQEQNRLNIVSDQIGCPTYAKDLALSILKIIPNIKNSDVEIYHFSNEGSCSWYDFAKAIFEFSNITCDVFPIETAQYPTPAKRPIYGVLNKLKIKNTYNISVPYWKSSLRQCLLSIKI